MSSIDKYVEEHAKNIDRRVRVTNSGGRIVGRINGQKVFDIPDRYGYLNDNERGIIQRAMATYLNEERHQREEEERRRREEEERRRREEEERRRRLEEQRQRSIASARTVIEAKKKEVENFYSHLTTGIPALNGVDKEITDSFDISGIIANANNQLSNLQKDALKEIEGKKNAALATLNSSLKSLPNVADAASADRLASQASSLHPSFNSSEYTERASKVQEKLNSTIQAATKVLRQLLDFDKKYNSPTSKSLLQRVKNIKISSTKELQEVVNLIQTTIGAIEEEKEKAEFQKVLQELNKENAGLMEVHLLADVNTGHTYEIPKFTEEINEVKTTITAIRESLLTAEYSTISTELMSEVENYLSEFKEGEENFAKGQDLLNKLETTRMQDARLEPAYTAFKRAREDAISKGCDIDFDFDPDNPDAQLDEIADRVVAIEIEQANELMWERGTSTQALMDGLGYEMLGIKEHEGMLVYIYARQDLKGVVMQVTVTEEGVRRKLIGVKEGDKETSNEQIKQMAQLLEQQEEPMQFMEGYKVIYPDCYIASDCGFSDTPGIEEVLDANGVYDLDEENKISEFRQITNGQNTEQNITIGVSVTQVHRVSVNAVIDKERTEYKQKKVAQAKKRYQTK